MTIEVCLFSLLSRCRSSKVGQSRGGIAVSRDKVARVKFAGSEWTGKKARREG